MLDENTKNELIRAARRAREQAYAPYSRNFLVGAAALSKEGKIFAGCNIENASFGATVCAERVAVFKAISEGCRDLVAIAVIADTSRPIPPCGLCRQVIAEFARDAEVIMANMSGDIEIMSLRELLPRVFDFNKND